MLRLAKTFAKHPFQPVSPNRCWYLLARYRKSKARAVTRLVSDQDGYTGISVPGIVLKYLLKFESSR
jgi:hypothetical protein